MLAFTAPDERLVAERDEREQSGDDVDVWGERLPQRRLRLRRGDGSETTLSPAQRTVTEFTWSPAGSELAVALAPRPDPESPAGSGVDLMRLSLDGGTPRHVCHVPFGAGNLTWTGDGAALLFTGWESGSIPSSRAIFLVAADGGTPRCLTTGLPSCVLSLVQPTGATEALCTVAEGLTTAVYALDPRTGALSLRLRPARGAAQGELGCDRGGRLLALVCSAGDEPPEVWAGTSADDLRRLSGCNPALAGITWAVQEPFAWTGGDGLALDGLVLRPPEVAGTPAGVVLPHGGPYGRYVDGFNCSPLGWAQWLALDGYAVLLPNPRGGAGHGHAFAATVAGEVGQADWQDVVAGTNAFVASGYADRERLGIGGWSQGGFMTAWAVSGGAPSDGPRGWDDHFAGWRSGSADLYRAGVMGAGISDWGAMWEESDLPTFEAMLGGSKPSAGVGPHRHAVVSPISYAARTHTPVQILHGRNDERVPVGQATAFFRALRERGVPAEMALYPREPHGVREDRHVIDLLSRVRAWYRRWL
jgi:dipeptidyl aminopeptidase/acylaminoacyl peptidase